MQQKDVVFDYQQYEAAEFTAQVASVSTGSLPFNKKDKQSGNMIIVELNGFQVEWQSLSNPDSLAIVDSFELTKGNRKTASFMKACQDLGIRSLAQLTHQKYFLVKRHREVFGKDASGRDIAVRCLLPIKILTAEEIARIAALPADETVAEPVEKAESLMAGGEYWADYLLSLLDGVSIAEVKSLIASDPVIISDTAFAEAIPQLLRTLTQGGKLGVSQGKYQRK